LAQRRPVRLSLLVQFGLPTLVQELIPHLKEQIQPVFGGQRLHGSQGFAVVSMLAIPARREFYASILQAGTLLLVENAGNL